MYMRHVAKLRHLCWSLASALIVNVLLLTLLGTVPVVARSTVAQAQNWHAVVGVENSTRIVQGMVFLPHELWINVGDRVDWTSRAGNIHTVTFLPAGQTFATFNADYTRPAGSTVYDGKSYYNSGVLSTLPGGLRFYSLRFMVPGNFTYYCLLHPSMIAVVHVRPAGTNYPYTQAFYDQQISLATNRVLLDGNRMVALGESSVGSHFVVAGIGDGLVSVMRFYPQQLVIHVRETVTFKNLDVMEPHTIVFGPVPKNDMLPYGNPRAFDGTAGLGSGFLGANPAWSGTTFNVTFVKAGTFQYICTLHAMLGMIGTIVVLP